MRILSLLPILSFFLWVLPPKSTFASMENQIAEDQKLGITEILKILRDPQIRETDPDRLAQAIERAGALKVTAAIDDLIGLLTFRQIMWWEKRKPNAPIRGRHGEKRYPATEALYLIGKPALPALVKVIETHEEASMESKHALYTVRLIFRYKPEGSGRAYLEEAAKRASSTPEAQKLLKASEQLADVGDDYKSP